MANLNPKIRKNMIFRKERIINLKLMILYKFYIFSAQGLIQLHIMI